MKYKKFNSSNRKYKLFISLLVVSLLLGFVLYESYAKYRREKTVDIIGGVVSLSKVCEYELGQSWDFDYTGGEQEFVVPCNGIYKLETWGAQGGISNNNFLSDTEVTNFGGYSLGNIILNYNSSLYVIVGEMGKECTGTLLNGVCSPTQLCPNTGGYNGGGDGRIGSHEGAGGGGATHVAITSRGILSNYNSYRSDLLMVAGGGGGTSYYSDTATTGGGAGGYIGNDGHDTIIENNSIYGEFGFIGTGGTQTIGGFTYDSSNVTEDGSGSFGLGGTNSTTTKCNANGGGAGYYGGGASNRVHGSAGGGSGYIGNSLLTDKAMYCYNCTESNDFATKTISNTCHSSAPTEKCSKEGNGYARITLVQYDLEPPTLSVNNNVVSIDEQGFAINGIKRYDYYITSGSDIPDKNTIPTGTITNSITLDINNDSTIYVRTVDNNNRKGSWSVGYSVLYYNCDFQPGYSWNYDYTGNEQEFVAPCAGTYKIELWGAQGGSEFKIAGGAYTSGEIDFKKGNNVYVYVGKHGGESNSLIFNYGYQNYKNEGGGSTDIRLYNGTWNSLKSLTSRVMVAAGGGNSGGLNSDDGGSPYGGSGGGLVGYQGGNCISKNVTSHPGAIGADQTNGHAFGEVPKLLTSDASSRYNTSGGNGYWSGNFYDWVGVGGHTAVSGSGGGSSFISGHTGCVSVSGVYETTPRKDNANVICTNGTTDPVCSYHFSGLKFTNTKMIDGAGYNWTTSKGAYVGEPEPDGTISTGHTGNGHAKITLLEPKKDTEETVTINSVTGGSTTWSNNKSFTINATATSGIKQYEYILKSTYNNSPDFYTIPTGTSTSNVININKTAKYIFFRVETNDGHKSDWYGPVDCYVDEKYIVAYLQNYSYTGYDNLLTPGSLMEINPNNTYVETISVRSNNQTARYYFGIIEYDVDLYEIQNRNSAWQVGSTTYLTKPLKNGDTVVYLNSTKNFIDSTANYHLGFIIWNYYDSTGYLYPKETYSRHVYYDLFVSSGINRTNNTITLKQPWKNGMIPSGTYLSQSTDGGTYNYGLLSYGTLTNSYTTYTNTITGSGMSSNLNTFRYGTKYIKGLVLHNYQNTTSTATLDITNFNITKK